MSDALLRNKSIAECKSNAFIPRVPRRVGHHLHLPWYSPCLSQVDSPRAGVQEARLRRLQQRAEAGAASVSEDDADELVELQDGVDEIVQRRKVRRLSFLLARPRRCLRSGEVSRCMLVSLASWCHLGLSGQLA